jgi:hypothetical protein
MKALIEYINIKDKKPKHGSICMVRRAFYSTPELKAVYDVYTFAEAGTPSKVSKGVYETFKVDTFIKRHGGARRIDHKKAAKIENKGQAVLEIVNGCLNEWVSIIEPCNNENYHIYWVEL